MARRTQPSPNRNRANTRKGTPETGEYRPHLEGFSTVSDTAQSPNAPKHPTIIRRPAFNGLLLETAIAETGGQTRDGLLPYTLLKGSDTKHLSGLYGSTRRDEILEQYEDTHSAPIEIGAYKVLSDLDSKGVSILLLFPNTLAIKALTADFDDAARYRRRPLFEAEISKPIIVATYTERSRCDDAQRKIMELMRSTGERDLLQAMPAEIIRPEQTPTIASSL